MIVRNKSPSVGIGSLVSLNLNTAAVEIARALLVEEGCRRSVAVAIHPMAAEAPPLIDLLAVGDPFLRARHRDIRDLELLRLEQVAPLAAVHAELLHVSDESLQVLRLGGDLDRVACIFLVAASG